MELGSDSPRRVPGGANANSRRPGPRRVSRMTLRILSAPPAGSAEEAGCPRVGIFAARTGRAFVGTPEFEGFPVEAVDLLTRVHAQRHHHAITHGRRLGVMGDQDAEARLVHRHAVGVTAAIVPQALRADVREQCIVERRCMRQVVGAWGDVSDYLQISRDVSDRAATMTRSVCRSVPTR